MKYVVILRVLFVLLYSAMVLAAHASPPINFQKRLIDNNLPNVGIYSIAQDHQGYLWLSSTNTGLLQFDGYQFQHHSLLNRSLTQLNWVPDIDALLFDQHNNLWVGSWGYGLARINADDGSIELFNDIPSDTQTSAFVQKLFLDQQQRVWVGTTDGINRYDDVSGLVRIDQPESALNSRRIWDFAQTANGTMWIATSAGLYSWRDESGFSAAIYPQNSSAAKNEVRALHAIGNILWLGTSEGLFKYQPETQLMQQVNLPNQQELPLINTLATSIDDNLLIGTFSGIYAVNPQTNEFQRRYQHKLVELENINVRSFYVDRSQVTWVGTREGGLFFKTRQRRAFQNISDQSLLQLQSNLTAPVLSLLAEPEQLWLGQYGNLIRYDHANQQQQQFSLPGRINVIRRAPDNVVWVGTDNGVFRQHTDNGNFERYDAPFNAMQLPQQNARDIQFTDDNKTVINLWNKGILLIDNDSGKVQQFLPNINKDAVGDAIQALHITSDHIWLASRLSGIYLLNRHTLNIQPLHQTNPSSLLTQDATGQLTCMAGAPDNAIAVCTEHGLLLIQPGSGKVTLLNHNAGLNARSLVGAYTDKNNTLWLLSTTGLYAVQPDGSIIQFDGEDGLYSEEIMFRAVAEDQHQLYFGSGAGLELVNPALLRAQLPATQQAISKITFDQRQVSVQSKLAPLSQISIPPQVYRVGFHFASFDFNNPKRNSYRYMLEGYDTDWQSLQDGNVASYTNLAPGNYTLKMVASNNQHRFNDTVSTLNVEVLPYWWQRKTVQFFALLLLVLLASWLVKRRISQVDQMNALLQQAMQQKNLRQAELENAVAERTAELQLSLEQQKQAYDELQHLDLLKDQFISTVSHELRTPLTSISGALQLVLSGAISEDKAKMQHLLQIASSNSKRLTLLINDLLDLEKLAANKMHFELLAQPLHPIIQRAVAENSTYSQERRVKLQYQAADECLSAIAQVDEHRLLQVLANVLSNAIKFSPQDGLVRVQLYSEGQKLIISIADEGPGIAPEFQPRIFQRFSQANSGNTRQQGGTGLGLALSQELMHAMHGDITFVSKPSEGCTFYLHLALQQ